MSNAIEGWAQTDCLVHWRRDGAEAATIVLLHEMGGSVHSFDQVVEELGDCGHALLRIDQRGFGLSEKPRGAYPFAALADDVVAVLDAAAVAGPAVVVGVAGGSAIAADLAVRYPDRVGRLVLCAPSLGFTAEARAATKARAEHMLGAAMNQITDGALAAMYPEGLRGPEFAAYRGRFMANDPVGFALANRALAEAETPLDRIAAPTLLLAGAQDIRPVEAVQALANVIPQAEVAVVPRGGHVMAVQAPGDVAGHIRRFGIGS